MVQLFQGSIELGQQIPVCGLVIVDARESLLGKQLLFTLKMHLGEVDQTLELQAEGAAVGSAEQHEAQFIQAVHQNPVLIVHGLYADDARVAPRQLRHSYLHDQS